MSISRKSVLRNLHNYSQVQLENLEDSISTAIIVGRIGSSWHEIIHAIDAEIDRRLGYPALFGA